ncbi:unnamed protein product, partial [Heterosigma akashiwo]
MTLGADDGAGIAGGLALMDYFSVHYDNANDSKVIPIIDLLLTVNEETDFSGAENLDGSMICSNKLLNVDSEEDGSVCIGSAGGFEHSFESPMCSCLADDLHTLYIKLTGLSGGHSGVDIHKDPGNAIEKMAELMTSVISTSVGAEPRLLHFSGGTNANSIPRECQAVLAFPSPEAARAAEEHLTKKLR